MDDQELKDRIKLANHPKTPHTKKVPGGPSAISGALEQLKISQTPKTRTRRKNKTRSARSAQPAQTTQSKSKKAKQTPTHPIQTREVYLCFKCDRKYKTKRGLAAHMAKCT